MPEFPKDKAKELTETLNSLNNGHKSAISLLTELAKTPNVPPAALQNIKDYQDVLTRHFEEDRRVREKIQQLLG